MLATYAYDALGRRTSLAFGNGTSQAYGFDPVSRLASLTNDLTGTTNDLSATFAYNPASQIASTVRTGDAYAWTGHFDQNLTGTANGLNQLTSVGPKTLTHDSKGNVTAFGTRSFGYSSENLLITGPNAATLSYDPVMRLHQTVSGGATAKFAYDGLDRIAEFDAANALQRRFVHGPGVDEPLAWYEGTGTANRRFLGSDERGSVISVTDGAGALLGLNRYDEYGQPQATNLGVFGYTGQAWLPSVGLWYYKARVYEPELGRFLQPDPIGYAGGTNLYAYVGNDPVNLVDPLGLTVCRADACVYGSLRRVDGLARAMDTIGFNMGGPWGVTVPREATQNFSPTITVVGTRLAKAKPPRPGPRTVFPAPPQSEKKLPRCAQNFLKGRISGNPANITLHRGGSIWNWFGNSVTYGSNIYLAGDSFDRTGPNAFILKFHEIGHTSQNARMGLSALHHGAGYVAFTGHDSSPLEQAADDFGQATYDAYKKAGLDKTCPF